MIIEPKYVSRKDEVALINLNGSTNTFDNVENGLSVHNEGAIGVKWKTENNKEVSFFIKDTEFKVLSAYPTPDMRFMTVIYSDEEIKAPNNAVVLDENGLKIYQIFAPERLSISEGGLLPSGKLTGFMDLRWSENTCFMLADLYIGKSDFIETRLLRMTDFQFDQRYFRTWRL